MAVVLPQFTLADMPPREHELTLVQDEWLGQGVDAEVRLPPCRFRHELQRPSTTSSNR